MVERQADPRDGRASVLAVTDAGRAMVDRMRQRRTANLSRIIDDWPLDDQKNFVRLLGKFIDGYAAHRPEMISEIGKDLPTKHLDTLGADQ